MTHEPLSPQGMNRREEMIEDAVQLATRFKRRRQMRNRVLGVIGCLALVVTLASMALTQRDSPGRMLPVVDQSMHRTSSAPTLPDQALADANSRDAANPGTETGTVQEEPIVKEIETDHAVLVRFTPRPSARVERISDDELLQVLEDIGRPRTLIPDGTRLKLSAPVDDKSLGT